jgi:UDP-GlcNAc:undecaprenyl-phosphate/decaprenyl-phosphate GlcNAc-1-phosphate transferase
VPERSLLASLPLAGGAALIVSMLLSLYLTPLFRDSARRFGIVDRPDGALKTQEKAVPYFGGLAVYLAMLLPGAIFVQFSDTVMGLLLASSIIILLGLVDDICGLSPRIKLLGQVIAVFLLIKSGIRIRIEQFPPILNIALTFLWMIVMTNGFNLIDVMDGLSGGVACVSAAAMGLVFLSNGNRIGFVLCAALLGSLLGFLRFNRPPAQIYLGDTGSLFLGFFLGGLAIRGDYTDYNPLGWLTPLALFSVPLFEIAFVSWLRMRRGVSIMTGSRDHFGLRLRRWRLTTGQTVLASCAAAAVSSGIGLAAMRMTPTVSIAAYGSGLLLLVGIALWLKAIDMGM